jgi:hypothetical protein
MTAPLVYLDGFDHQDLTRYGLTGTPTFVTGRYADYALQTSINSQIRIIPSSGLSNEISLGVSVRPTAWTTSGQFVDWSNIAVLDNADHVIAGMTFADSGNPLLIMHTYRNGPGGSTTTGSTQLILNVWQTVEFRFTWSSTGTGLAEIRLNGAVVATYSGNTNCTTAGYGTPARIRLASPLPTGSYQWDDLWVESGSGAGYRGDRRVALIKPTADNTIQWDSSTGANHWSVVADNSDTTYITTASGTGKKDTFDFADLAAGIITVEGVQVSAMVRKSDIGAANAAVHRGGTAGTTRAVTVATGSGWQQVSEVFATTSDGSTAWTPTNVNSSTFGVVAAA